LVTGNKADNQIIFKLGIENSKLVARDCKSRAVQNLCGLKDRKGD